MTGIVLCGAGRRNLQQRHSVTAHVAANYYPTPPAATRALLSVERFDASIWEPACGAGHIAKVLSEAGHPVVASDLNDWGYGEPGRDFLAATAMPEGCAHIVTNPPYGQGLADRFVAKALELATGKVAMLLNLASLAHPTRTPLWHARPPARLYAIDSVVCWPDVERAPPAHFREHRYMWAVWEPGHRGPPALWWLSARDFR